MDEQRRVTFRFDEATEVHYLVEVPSPGDFVTHGHELWRVSRVDTDPLGTLVICERPTHADPVSQLGAREVAESE